MNHVRSLGRRLGLAGVAVVVALVPMAAVPLATAQAQTSASADLAVTMRWIGNGAPRAKVGELASFAIAVTNRGPDTAVNTLLRIVGDELLTDADSSSRITIPHYAAGSLDQRENPAAHRQQITFACWPAGPAGGRGQDMSAVAPPVDA